MIRTARQCRAAQAEDARALSTRARLDQTLAGLGRVVVEEDINRIRSGTARVRLNAEGQFEQEIGRAHV